MRYRQDDHIAATQIVDSAMATVPYRSMAFDASESKYNRSSWLKPRYLPSWSESVDVSQRHAIKQLDGSLSIDERPSDAEPLMTVGIGSSSLRISLYTPAFR